MLNTVHPIVKEFKLCFAFGYKALFDFLSLANLESDHPQAEEIACSLLILHTRDWPQSVYSQ